MTYRPAQHALDPQNAASTAERLRKDLAPCGRWAVNTFNIDCRANDRRHLPLINLLYDRLANMDSGNWWLTSHVFSRDGEVRIYDVVERENGERTNPTLALEINRWGELRPIGFSVEAVLAVCRGVNATGPIWVIPEE